jgi:hypothetical protein
MVKVKLMNFFLELGRRFTPLEILIIYGNALDNIMLTKIF